ncbi:MULTISPECIES: PaaX family transcriptional regulator C-terminal domain-containing protein [unclassified Mycobacterium]|uniref:PaaX family transcriptional regulator n=1 Tax=unclassified Mycobacterium TaxID=2642494 RepID=UPI0029C92834|nr:MULTISPECIES: PaaX family transcriptional regulator C-terminal domain-containing protein [unclassified Mycobacterium]
MNHRSLIFDLFGGYIRYAGGRISLRSLAAVVEPFGVSTDALRVVMSRLRREGWQEVTRTASGAEYRATAEMWEVLDEGYDRIFRPAEPAWDGQWRMVIYEVPETERALRDQLRKQLAWLGFGQLVSSTWLSCHDRLDAVGAWVAEHPVARIETLVARSQSEEQDRRFAHRCWDLDTVAADYAAFVRQFGSTANRHSWEHAQGVDALVARVRLVHEYRLFAFRDPRLPGHLLPDAWPGPSADRLFAQAYNHLETEAVAAFEALTGAAVVIPDRETYR